MYTLSCKKWYRRNPGLLIIPSVFQVRASRVKYIDQVTEFLYVNQGKMMSKKCSNAEKFRKKRLFSTFIFRLRTLLTLSPYDPPWAYYLDVCNAHFITLRQSVLWSICTGHTTRSQRHSQAESTYTSVWTWHNFMLLVRILSVTLLQYCTLSTLSSFCRSPSLPHTLCLMSIGWTGLYDRRNYPSWHQNWRDKNLSRRRPKTLSLCLHKR